jgi:uncharacterized phage protein gp47/JayE
MSLTISDFELPQLAALNATDVQQLLEQLATQLQELNPSLDLKRGVFHDTLAYYHAVLEAAIRTNLERYQSARSLQQIEADPTLADDTVVNEVLSNWGVIRKTGTRANGPVTIELTQARSVVVPAGFVFEASGRTYAAVDTYTARPTAGQVSDVTDRLLVQLSNGNWAFTIEVEADVIGAESKLNAGDLLVPNGVLSGYATSYATSTFTDGTNTETNAELLSELQLGISAKTLSNRTNMRSYLRSIPAFASATNQSIVGYGDAEMLRDQHTIFPISYGGRVDWYIRGQEALQRQARTVQATCVAEAETSSTWQFSFGKDDVPGFYEVTKIRRVLDEVLNSGFEIVQDNRGNDLTGDGFLPDIATVAEGAYTAYQTTTIRFVDTVTPVAGLTVGQSTATYVCEVLGTPLVREIQALVSSRDVRSYAADALVKAPVPCFVQVALTINKTAGDTVTEATINAIKLAIVRVINQTDFLGRLDGSHIVDAVHGFLQGNLSVTELDLFGRIRRPDGSLQYVRDADALIIPEQPAKMVTAKTVQFFAEVADISVNVASTIPTAK